MTADKIGVRMGLYYVLDLVAVRVGFIKILLNIALRIFDRRLAFGADVVGSMRKAT